MPSIYCFVHANVLRSKAAKNHNQEALTLFNDLMEIKSIFETVSNPLQKFMRNLSVLIAEDDADDRFLMQKAIDEAGSDMQIEFVENGVELLSNLNNRRSEKTMGSYPKFILLDLNMPKMDGREVLRNIKTHEEFKKIPVIVFSTTKNQLEVRKCYELGANTYIVKPANFSSLVETMQHIRTYWFETATLADAV